METIVQKTCCGICENEQERGFYLYQMFICEACEKGMVNTSPEDSGYTFFVKKLKGITKTIAHS